VLTGGVGASVAGSPRAVRAEVAELLGVSADTVDPGGNLISQGLDSIRMMSLAGRWRRRGIAVDFAALAADPTVEAWSLLVSGSRDDAAKPADSQFAAAPTGTPEDAFPLAPMQHAMWVGRHDSQPLGGVAGHLYVEFDGGAIDPERLRQAATNLTRRHPMLRVRFLSDGTQQIGPAQARANFPVTVHDFRDLAEDVVDQRLTGLREAKSHQQLDGQVLELTLSLLPGGSSRLHVDLDMQAADAMSYRTLMADLAKLYRGQQLAELHYSYREYRQEIVRREAGPQPAHDADRDWWSRRIPELPDPPRLPSASRKTFSRNSTRRWQWLDARTRDALVVTARARGVTPAMMFAAAFAHTLACWSGTSRFLLNVPLFGR
jgi:mycobactin phenyloxazoline synthetase